MNGNNIYEMVTNRIIEELEKGIIPWQKPWHGVRAGAYNRISKKPYSILNQMLLSKEGEWATFKQWTDIGGKVKKGSKSELVVFWKLQPFEEVKEDGEKVVKHVPILRYYNVFHISQVENVEPLEVDFSELAPIEEAEQIKEAYKNREKILIEEIVSDKAFYSPLRDYIQVPCRKQYSEVEEFYSTLFHEMIHSTGHRIRLDRLDTSANSAFGSEIYSKEELVAELGSAYILNMLGIESEKSFRNSTGYIQGWLRKLKDDPKFIVSASARAEKAVNYILNGEA